MKRQELSRLPRFLIASLNPVTRKTGLRPQWAQYFDEDLRQLNRPLRQDLCLIFLHTVHSNIGGTSSSFMPAPPASYNLSEPLRKLVEVGEYFALA